ncbi:MAG: Uncharacterised protein [Prochlorococcus marinus str. MIT 9215]|nr:MAG: Uncharacterised protein [Prochlorococcus marinus str. MIT 9215]
MAELTRILGQHFSSPLIVSVEPNSALWDKVIYSAKSDSNFVLARCALGTIPGTAFLETYAQNTDDSYNSNLSTLSSRPAFPEVAGYVKHSRLQVRVNTLDNLTESYDHQFIDVLKIDVEGYEPEVIKGGKKMLVSHSIGIIITEFSSILGKEAVSGSLTSIAKLLEPYGFIMVSVCTDYVTHGLSTYANHNAIWVNPCACIAASSSFA